MKMVVLIVRLCPVVFVQVNLVNAILFFIINKMQDESVVKLFHYIPLLSKLYDNTDGT